jgi:hypothetical protein
MKSLIYCTIIFFLCSAEQCSTPLKSMDVVNNGSGWDENGLMLNPAWQYQVANNGSLPDICQLCPCDNNDAGAWNSAPNCTNNKIRNNRTENFFTWSGRDCSIGHMNYFPVTYEGQLYFEEHSPSAFDDDDYTFDVTRPDNALYCTRRNGQLHAEFNSDETVDNWDNTQTWWNDFHHNVVDQDQNAARAKLYNKESIIIGLLGLDLGHGSVFAELHPIYAMFFRENDQTNINDDVWHFFVRNSGDEGYCSNYEEYLDLTKITIKIPSHFDNLNCSLSPDTKIYCSSDDLAAGTVGYQTTDSGMFISFTLKKPEDRSWYVGDLHIQWIPNPKKPPVIMTKVIDTKFKYFTHHESDGNDVIEKRVMKLDTTSLKELKFKLQAIKPIPPKPHLVMPFAIKEKFKQTKPIKDYSKLVYSGRDTVYENYLNKKNEIVMNHLKINEVKK